jgi:hypothetical protein
MATPGIVRVLLAWLLWGSPCCCSAASPCAAALARSGCAATQGQGAACTACLAAHAALLAPCRVPGSKCAKGHCLGKYCAGAPGTAPGKMCYNAAGINGVCGRDFPRCLPREPAGGPQYHIRDLTCGTSDVNAPFRDPATGYWHVFYQDLLLTNKSVHRAKVWGHVVSTDGVHWRRMPVALWVRGAPPPPPPPPPPPSLHYTRSHPVLQIRQPDEPYDNTNIFSGSANVVDGKVMLVCKCSGRPPPSASSVWLHSFAPI